MGRSTSLRGTFVRAAAFPAITALLTACGGGSEEGGLTSDDEVLVPAVEDLYEVGAATGEEWELFGGSIAVGFDGYDRLHIFDPENFRVVVIDDDGSFSHEFGRQGDGPGELGRPGGMVVGRDGAVWVMDSRARGFAQWNSEGEYVRSFLAGIPTTSRDGLGYTLSGHVVVQGTGLRIPDAARRSASSDSLGGMSALRPGQQIGGARGARRGGGGGGGGREGGGIFGGGGGGERGGFNFGDFEPPTTVPIRRISLRDGSEDTLHQAWLPALPEELEERTQGNGRGRGRGGFGGSSNVAFLPRVIFAAYPDGSVAVADSSTYRIRIVGPEGSIERTLERPITPRPVTKEVEKAERERRIAALESGDAAAALGIGGGDVIAFGVGRGGRGAAFLSGDLPPEMVERQREQIETMPFAPEIPVLQRLVTDWEGNLWVERSGAHPGAPGPIDLFDRSGTYLGTIPSDGLRIPDAFGPDGLAAYIERDEYDVPIIRVRRLSLIPSTE